MPAVIDEGNSVVCEGQDGVSNVFASALWEIDDQLLTAREGVSGDYKHGTVVQCGSAKPLYMYYTPAVRADRRRRDRGRPRRPAGVLRPGRGPRVGTGDFLNVTNPDSGQTCTPTPIKHSNGTMTVVLDDLQDPSSNGATSLQLDLPASYGSGETGGPDRERPVRHQRHHPRRADGPVRRNAGGADRDAGLTSTATR